MMGYTDIQLTFGQWEKMTNYLISVLFGEQRSDFGHSPCVPHIIMTQMSGCEAFTNRLKMAYNQISTRLK